MFKVSKKLQMTFRDVKQLTAKYLMKIKKIKHRRKIAMVQYEDKKTRDENDKRRKERIMLMNQKKEKNKI